MEPVSQMASNSQENVRNITLGGDLFLLSQWCHGGKPPEAFPPPRSPVRQARPLFYIFTPGANDRLQGEVHRLGSLEGLKQHNVTSGHGWGSIAWGDSGTFGLLVLTVV